MKSKKKKQVGKIFLYIFISIVAIFIIMCIFRDHILDFFLEINKKPSVLPEDFTPALSIKYKGSGKTPYISTSVAMRYVQAKWRLIK